MKNDKVKVIYGVGIYLLIASLIWAFFGWNDVVFIMLLSISWIPVYFIYYIATSLGTYIGKCLRRLKISYVDWRVSQYFKEFENDEKSRQNNG